MIVNVVNGQSYGSRSGYNMFDGMSLAEACGQLTANVSNALNEMNMSILIKEHLFLRENGYEIDYITESKGILDSIKKTLEKVKKTVSDLWDKLTIWVRERYEDAKLFVKRHMVNQASAKLLANSKLTIDVSNINLVKIDQSYSADYTALIGIIKSIKMDNTTLQKFRDEFNDDNTDNMKDTIKIAGREAFAPAAYRMHINVINPAEISRAYDAVFETDNKTIRNIIENKKDAIHALDACKKFIKNDKKSDDNDSNIIKVINKAIKLVTKASKIAIKLYHEDIDSSVKVLQIALKEFEKKNRNDTAYSRDSKAYETAANKKNELKAGFAVGFNDAINKRKQQETASESFFFDDDRFFSV